MKKKKIYITKKCNSCGESKPIHVIHPNSLNWKDAICDDCKAKGPTKCFKCGVRFSGDWHYGICNSCKKNEAFNNIEEHAIGVQQ